MDVFELRVVPFAIPLEFRLRHCHSLLAGPQSLQRDGKLSSTNAATSAVERSARWRTSVACQAAEHVRQ